MRTLIQLTLIMLVFQSCNKFQNNQSDELSGNSEYFLDFDIMKADYNEPDQESQFVDSDQVVDFVTFYDLNDSDRYFYFNIAPPSSIDSVTLIGAVDFESNDISTFGDDQIRLELLLTENKSNLVALADGAYRYKTNETLYQKLQEGNFGNQGLFSNKYVNQLLLTFPSVSDTTHSVGYEMLSSNGFYFEHEILDLTTIDYDSETNAIELGGGFDVNVKMLSCGFYDFYYVTNAEFFVEIR